MKALDGIICLSMETKYLSVVCSSDELAPFQREGLLLEVQLHRAELARCGIASWKLLEAS